MNGYFVRVYVARGGFHSNGVVYPTLDDARAAAEQYLATNRSLIGAELIERGNPSNRVRVES